MNTIVQKVYSKNAENPTTNSKHLSHRESLQLAVADLCYQYQNDQPCQNAQSHRIHIQGINNNARQEHNDFHTFSEHYAEHCESQQQTVLVGQLFDVL